MILSHYLFTFLIFSFFLGLFGEGPAERRERLKSIISMLSDDEIAKKLKKKEEQEKREEESQNVIILITESSTKYCLILFI